MLFKIYENRRSLIPTRSKEALPTISTIVDVVFPVRGAFCDVGVGMEVGVWLGVEVRVVVGVEIDVGVGIMLITGVGEGLTVGESVGVMVEIVGEGEGVRDAEGVDSPNTLSPLFKTINLRLMVIVLPFSSYP